VYYKRRKEDSDIIEKLMALAEEFPTRGFDKYYGLIRLQGLNWARSRVLRVYRQMKLCRRRKLKRRVPQRIKEPLQKQWAANQSYSMDFMSDALVTGRKLRVLKVMDDCTRESLVVWCDYSITGEKVTELLQEIIRERGAKPMQIRVDNGPEFTSKAFTSWCAKQSIVIKYIQPGKPMQNGYIERLNRSFREDVLDAFLLESLEEARIASDEWQYKYNHVLPHDSLDKITPVMMRKSLPVAIHSKQVIEQQQQVPDQQQNKQSHVSNESVMKV
jgi:putative transposase